jgi:hypothetical protein
LANGWRRACAAAGGRFERGIAHWQAAARGLPRMSGAGRASGVRLGVAAAPGGDRWFSVN